MNLWRFQCKAIVRRRLVSLFPAYAIVYFDRGQTGHKVNVMNTALFALGGLEQIKITENEMVFLPFLPLGLEPEWPL